MDAGVILKVVEDSMPEIVKNIILRILLIFLSCSAKS